MATLLNTKQKKEIEVFLPNFEEKKFIKETIDEKIRALKANSVLLLRNSPSMKLSNIQI